MKDKLIKLALLAQGKGFATSTVSTGNVNSHFLKGEQYMSTKAEYLWLCELQKFLRDIHKINIIIIPSFDCFNIQAITIYNQFSDENEEIDLVGLQFADFETFEMAMIPALLQGFNLIKS